MQNTSLYLYIQRDVLKEYGSFENIFSKLVVISIEKIERDGYPLHVLIRGFC